MPGNERRSHNPIRFENRRSQGDQHGGFDVLHLEACATVHNELYPVEGAEVVAVLV